VEGVEVGDDAALLGERWPELQPFPAGYTFLSIMSVTCAAPGNPAEGQSDTEMPFE